ncbi:ATPase [uncultured Dialister sp.]|uniref:ATPase n=1 Tax=uncultured Dialister sp. TaxID=278064 RepID=UPI0025CD7067|nr:ATPase [uncultured Dialister sp.]
MDTRKLLEELENVINNASDVPFTNKKMVDKDEVERLIDAINQSLPNELESARRIVADKERIMLDAEKKAEDNIAQAKDYIARITEESELVKQSQERANEIITSANKSAEELRTSSVTYATDVLKYVETNMENVLDSLKKNRQSLIDSNSASVRQQEQENQDGSRK